MCARRRARTHQQRPQPHARALALARRRKREIDESEVCDRLYYRPCRRRLQTTSARAARNCSRALGRQRAAARTLPSPATPPDEQPSDKPRKGLEGHGREGRHAWRCRHYTPASLTPASRCHVGQVSRAASQDRKSCPPYPPARFSRSYLHTNSSVACTATPSSSPRSPAPALTSSPLPLPIVASAISAATSSGKSSL
jgi:hypothetical protein